jgi:NADPH:quinone reductase-like Zn-dependent oxidoreductase
VSAAGINRLDKMVRNGEFKRLLTYRTPFVLGHDVAGVVGRVGSAVLDSEVGDEVLARPRDLRIGTFAEYIAIDQGDLAAKRPRSPCTRRPRCRWCHWLAGRPSLTAPST